MISPKLGQKLVVSISTFGVSVAMFLLAFSLPALAQPQMSIECDPCLASDGVVSVPVGARIIFQISDAQTAAREVIWRFGDGSKSYGLMASHTYRLPGKYKIEALVIYDTNTLPALVSAQVHVIAAPVLQQETFLGLPTSIAYPVLAAVAAVLIYWLTGTIPG